ncbi:MAG TPA: alpha-amylase family glycosyl hydrolase [Polyangiaceae bacterium]
MRWLFPLVVVGALGACDSAPAAPPFAVASCDLTLWYKPQSSLARVEVVTSWENWKTGAHVMDDAGDGWRAARVTPPPGKQEYAFLDDGIWTTDPFVGTTAFKSDGTEVTWIDQADCSVPSLRVDSASGGADGKGEAGLTFVAAHDAIPLNPASIAITPVDGGPATASATAKSDGTIAVAIDGLAPGKHVVSIVASDASGRAAPPARVTVWNESHAWDWNDAVIYQVMVDRYRSASGALAPPASPAGWAGGTVAGVTADLDAISARGFNTLWLSPLYLNPDGTFPGNDGRPYSAYHGYWPKASRALDPRFGTEADVDALLASAHARDMRVIFDVVPHHVHEEHPYATAHPGAPWFTDWNQDCVCGVGSCDWDTHIHDCWFATYLPSLDWHTSDVADAVTDDVAWWIDRFDADGLRIDAVPMMPRAGIRRIADAVRRRFDHPGQRSYLLGENFVGPDAYDLLRYELGSFGLDGEFDFPMMWELRSVIAQETGAMGDIDTTERAGEASWAGSGAIMSRMIGNHDVTRFSSVSAGDDGGDGWTPAVQSTDPLVYAKQRMALAIVYTLPGAVVVYYGDDVALAGRQDPDSRRVMPADAALSADQTATRDFVAKLGKVRACDDALRRGTYRALVTDAEALAYAREDPAENDAAIVVVTRNPTAPVTLPMKGLPAGKWVDALGSVLSFDASSATITMPGHSVAIFVPQTSACL